MPSIEIDQYKLFNFATVVILAALISFVCLFRVFVFNDIYGTYPERVVASDTIRYEGPAIHYVETGSMRDGLPMLESQDVHVTPAYPFFIAMVYKFIGNERANLVYAQIFVSLLSIVLVYVLATMMSGRQAGVAAAILFSAAPLQGLYTAIVLTETLFVFSVLVFCVAAVSFLKNYSDKPLLKHALYLGLAFGFSALVRPISYYLPFLFIIALLAHHLVLKKHHIAVYFKSCLGILLMFFVMVGPWQIRNHDIAGSYMFTDNPGKIMLYWKAAGLIAYRDGIDHEVVRSNLSELAPDNFASIAERADFEKKAGLAIIKDDIPSYALFSANSLVKILIGPGLAKFADFFGGQNVSVVSDSNSSDGFTAYVEKKSGYMFWYLCVIAYSLFYLGVVYISFVFGSFQYWKNSHSKITMIFLVATIAYFILASTGHSASDSRMRVPAMPLLATLGGIWLGTFVGGVRRFFVKR